MITALDANVVLDALVGTPEQVQAADTAMRSAKIDGSLIISAVAYAEVAGRFKSKPKADDFFSLLTCEVQSLDAGAAFLAGHFFREYRKRGGKRNRIIADFLIAAHAQLHADRILTSDSRFFGPNFPKLKAVSPKDMS